jgi:hypothetical protein
MSHIDLPYRYRIISRHSVHKWPPSGLCTPGDDLRCRHRSGAGLAAVTLAAVARNGLAAAAVGLVGRPVRLLALGVAVADRAEARGLTLVLV